MPIWAFWNILGWQLKAVVPNLFPKLRQCVAPEVTGDVIIANHLDHLEVTGTMLPSPPKVFLSPTEAAHGFCGTQNGWFPPPPKKRVLLVSLWKPKIALLFLLNQPFWPPQRLCVAFVGLRKSLQRWGEHSSLRLQRLSVWGKCGFLPPQTVTHDTLRHHSLKPTGLRCDINLYY